MKTFQSEHSVHQRSRSNGATIANALMGLALIALALTLMTQTISSCVRAERRVGERYIAMQWLAASLEKLRATGRVSSGETPDLRNARLDIRRKPIKGLPLHEATLIATWHSADGSKRSAILTSVIGGDNERG